MKSRTRDLFLTVKTEGGLLPGDFLRRLVEGDGEIEGLKPQDYHLAAGERITEAINRSWNRAVAAWTGFTAAREKLPQGDLGTSPTRERWLLILFQELGYGRLRAANAEEIGGKTYPISHSWGGSPIHLVGCGIDLEKRTPNAAGAARTPPHSLVQEYLNRSPDRLWGFVSNGLRLRVLRDNVSLTRQAYVEFDLEAMMEGEVYSDFVLFWLLCHQSRVEGDRPEQCRLECWVGAAKDRGTRALDTLRQGVEEAIEALGRGFLAHPANGDLRRGLREAELSTQDYYRQLLRMVYRLLFLFVAEDRDLLLHPEATTAARLRYERHYSTRRLREVARRSRGTRHSDLYESLRVVMQKLGQDDGCPELGLPALGSFLWSHEALPELDNAELPNTYLLAAVRALGYIEQNRTLRAIDYKNLGFAEFGSVYESLLELHPQLNQGAASFDLVTAGGHERKTSGSYYTPDSLVQCLLDSALDPVLDEATQKDDPEAAILALKVCDPAVGSGHFLIAAGHRMAKRLAFLRTGDEEPSPEATRTALRDVIGRCLYGVDVNPMAAELCRVSLWLEALEPGKPQSFLDHHIRVGNSLLGAAPELIGAGIPDEAFSLLQGDDASVCAALKARNRLEREGGQQDMLHLMVAEPEAQYNTLTDRAQTLDEAPDQTIGQVKAKAEQFEHLVGSAAYRHASQVADAWCAAFMWRKKGQGDVEPITTDTLRRLEGDPHALSMSQAAEVRRLAAEYKFFQWHLAFPDVAAKGGFSCLVGNPPWERVKLQEREFFATRDSEIAGARNKAARQRLIDALPRSNPALAREWAAALRRAESESRFFRLCGRFPLGGVGDVNTYAVFADLFRQLIAPDGTAALLLPNGLVTGFTYRAFLRQLLETRTLASFYGFENEDKLFPDVHNETKFGILTMTGIARPVQRAWLTAHCRQPSQVHDPERRYSLSAQEIAAINPNTLNLPAFRWAADAAVTAAIHAAAPVLVRRREKGEVDSPWGVSFVSMFHMSNDSHLFLDHTEIGPRIVDRRAALAVLNDGTEVYPLYEGKMLWHFDHRYGTYEGQTRKQANKGVLPHVDDSRHADPDYRIQPRYWVDAARVDQMLSGDEWNRHWYFGWRDVGPSERTFVGAVVPRTAAGHTMPVMVASQPSGVAAGVIATLSSLVVDYDARQQSTRMTFFVVEQLAVLTPDQLGEPRAWLGATATQWLTPRVLELTYTNVELEAFARDLGHTGPPFLWDGSRRARLQAEIDAAVLHLYGLDRRQAEWLLESFTVLRKYEERDYGEARTRRLVLEAYDQMDQAIVSGEAYHSRIYPPPADPRCCHPESTRPKEFQYPFDQPPVRKVAEKKVE